MVWRVSQRALLRPKMLVCCLNLKTQMPLLMSFVNLPITQTCYHIFDLMARKLPFALIGRF